MSRFATHYLSNRFAIGACSPWRNLLTERRISLTRRAAHLCRPGSNSLCYIDSTATHPEQGEVLLQLIANDGNATTTHSKSPAIVVTKSFPPYPQDPNHPNYVPEKPDLQTFIATAGIAPPEGTDCATVAPPPPKPDAWYRVSPFSNPSSLNEIPPGEEPRPFVVNLHRLLSLRTPETVIYPILEVENTNEEIGNTWDPTLPESGRAVLAPADTDWITHTVRLQEPVVLPEQSIAERILAIGSSQRYLRKLRPFGLKRHQVASNPYCLVYYLVDGRPIDLPILANPSAAIYPPITIHTPLSEVVDILHLRLAMEWAAYGTVPGDFPCRHPTLQTASLLALLVNAACAMYEPYTEPLIYERVHTGIDQIAKTYLTLTLTRADRTSRENALLSILGYNQSQNVRIVERLSVPGVYVTPLVPGIATVCERAALWTANVFWSRETRRLHRLMLSISSIDNHSEHKYLLQDDTLEDLENIIV